MDRQDWLIEQLIQRNIFKLPDERDLFEGSCEELAVLLERDGENEMLQVKRMFEVNER